MSTSRIEAFSDGVIAIIITIMVFDLKLQDFPTDNTVWHELIKLTPKLASYAISFIMLAVMWVNHHQLFHRIKHTDQKLLWHAIHLLFWMSLVPFGTNFIGANYHLWLASFFYGINFSMIALSFTLLRAYAMRHNMLQGFIDEASQIKFRNKNRVAMSAYLLAAVLSIFSVYISFILFLLVPAMYISSDS